MRKDFLFSSESVTEGHPDKLCDQISDAIIDHFLEQDPYARVIAECAVAKGIVFIAARFAARANADLAQIARRVIQQVGYNDDSAFNARDCTVMTSITEMPASRYSPVDESSMSEDELDRLGVKNQSNAFGYACNQTPALLPLPIWLAHRLARRLSAARLERRLPYLLPDGTTQVGVEFRDGKPRRIHSIALVTSHAASAPEVDELRRALQEQVIDDVFRNEKLRPDGDTQVFVNPDGPFVGGGPALHAGLTGRKTGIDCYGEYARHSESALSGKHPLRVDRVGAYAARYAAKNVVAAGLADECEVQLSYSIGIARPVSIQVETFGTGRIADDAIAGLLDKHFDFRVGGIVKQFSLRRLPQQVKGGFYRKLAAYGHVGRMDIGVPWEKTDRAALLAARG
jgi:S-adenosylmethionine synthetase